MFGMATNMSALWADSISIWDLAMPGWSVNPSGSNASMDGKDTIMIGGCTRYAMTVSETIAMDIFTRGVASLNGGGGTNVKQPSRPRHTLGEDNAPLINTQL
jgi:hypothetical protein